MGNGTEGNLDCSQKFIIISKKADEYVDSKFYQVRKKKSLCAFNLFF